MSANDALDLDHPWAGGIDDGETGFFQLQLGLGRNAVRPDQDGAGAAVGNLSQNRDTFALKQIEDLGIVDQGAESVYGALLVTGGIHDHFDGAANSHTKTGRLCDQDLHRAGDIRSGDEIVQMYIDQFFDQVRHWKTGDTDDGHVFLGQRQQ